MKLRNIFTALAAAAFAFVGCQVEERFLDEIQVSQSIVALDVAGDQVEVTVNANDAWEIVGMPEWLTASPVSGAAGETVVTFSAEATTETREAVFYINVGEVQQVMNALQMAEKVETPLSTCKDVINGVDGKVYKIKGTVTSIVNTQYGNWYLQDDTGSVYVYGTLYNGATQQFTKLGLEVGDIVTIEGPRKDYNGTIELVDVTVLEIEKSLIKLEKVFPAEALPLEGGVATALLSVKEGDVEVVIPEDATWLTAGEPAALGGMVSVELTAAPNEGGARKTTVTFKVNVNDKDYVAMATIEQLGAISEVTVAEFIAAAEGTALFEITGKISKITSAYNEKYGNISFNLMDATGEVAVYRMSCEGIADPAAISEGDVVTVQGVRASYKDAPQVGEGSICVNYVGSTVATVAEFLAQPVAADKWYKLTGKIANLKSDVYGNFDLVDETGSVYVYGVTAAPVAKNDKSFASLGVKEGDTITIVGTRYIYEKDGVKTDQVGGPAYYISHEEGAPAVDPWTLETVVSYDLPESASSSRQVLRNIKYVADADNLYIKLQASASLFAEKNVAYLGLMLFDTITGTSGSGYWGWWKDAKGNVEFNKEHAGTFTGTDLVVTVGETQVVAVTEKADDALVWTMAIPRSATEVLAAKEVYLGALVMEAWEPCGAMPDKYEEMLKVTLP